MRLRLHRLLINLLDHQVFGWRIPFLPLLPFFLLKIIIFWFIFKSWHILCCLLILIPLLSPFGPRPLLVFANIEHLEIVRNFLQTLYIIYQLLSFRPLPFVFSLRSWHNFVRETLWHQLHFLKFTFIYGFYPGFWVAPRSL